MPRFEKPDPKDVAVVGGRAAVAAREPYLPAGQV